MGRFTWTVHRGQVPNKGEVGGPEPEKEIQ